MLDCRALLLLWLLPWTIQCLAVPRSSSPDWAQCQQLSRSLCTLAWSAHPPVGHTDILREDEETSNDVPHIQCGDGCDPQGLKDDSQPKDHHWESQQMPRLSPSQQWQRPLLRSKILRSLQAFVAIAARVFAHGAATLTEPLMP
ncbi:hypothetical protein A6R68_00437 [Neotoma lepida]|uniref:Interleukin-23 subunit alpha n=1 Tax=Neotoma lepida TaxID=56216 RepID=A0A1A6GZN1_NEOLE|nr:hypothetical protein A6R68_00437 [Neotoma lepida]